MAKSDSYFEMCGDAANRDYVDNHENHMRCYSSLMGEKKHRLAALHRHAARLHKLADQASIMVEVEAMLEEERSKPSEAPTTSTGKPYGVACADWKDEGWLLTNVYRQLNEMGYDGKSQLYTYEIPSMVGSDGIGWIFSTEPLVQEEREEIDSIEFPQDEGDED